MRTELAVAFTIALCALPAQAKDPALGATTFNVYEAFLSPQQEPDEEDALHVTEERDRVKGIRACEWIE